MILRFSVESRDLELASREEPGRTAVSLSAMRSGLPNWAQCETTKDEIHIISPSGHRMRYAMSQRTRMVHQLQLEGNIVNYPGFKQNCSATFIEPEGECVKLAIIGSADRTKKMGPDHWTQMVHSAAEVIDFIRSSTEAPTILLSGGAPWADHVAVFLYLNGFVDDLHLYVPAEASRGWGIIKYHHQRFAQQANRASFKEMSRHPIRARPSQDMTVRSLFDRNSEVARNSTHILALTPGKTEPPKKSGTLDTWNKFKRFHKGVDLAPRMIHVSIPIS